MKSKAVAIKAQAWVSDNIPEQAGCRILVTGANTGIGMETARALASRGAEVLLGCRNVDKGEAAADQIRAGANKALVEVLVIDLGDLTSVRAAAESLRGKGLDVLINNAGIMAPPRELTKDGFESQFGVNHLGHFALTGLLLEQLKRAPAGRVVTVSSIAHRRGVMHFEDLNAEQSYSRQRQYAMSKLANLLFTFELDRRLERAGVEILALAAHPGISGTELGRDLPTPLTLVLPLFRKLVQSPEMGALPSLLAATDHNAAGGHFYGPQGAGELGGLPVRVRSAARAHDEDAALELWDRSEELTGVDYEL